MSPARPFAGGLVAIVSALALSVAVDSSQPTARDVVRAAQRAISVGSSVGTIQSFRIDGLLSFRFNAVTGELRSPEPTTLLVKFPDHYLRQSRNAAGIVTREGFAGRESLLTIVPPAGWVSSGTAPGGPSVVAPRRDLARLVLGMFAETERVVPFALTAADANTLVAKSDLAGVMTVVLDTSRMPVAIREAGKLAFPRRLTEAERKAGLMAKAPLEDVEVTFTFSDRRNVGGFMLPHRITKAARNVIFEDLRIDTFVINPPLSLDDFKR